MANEIFISYRRTDEPRARLFYNLLKERGVEAWYDAKIAAGEDWRTTTANALDAAPIFVLLMSRNASESGDIAKELAAATHKRKLVVPVRLDDMQLEGMFLYELASRNWIDAYKNTEERLAELADKLASLVKSDLSPEAAAALEMNAAEIAAAKGAEAKAKRMSMMKSGSVAVATAAVVALAAALGAGAWFLRDSTNAGAATAEASAAVPATDAQKAPSVNLAASLTEVATAAKEAGRSDAEIAALTEAGTKLAAMAEKAKAEGDAAALSKITIEMNDTALAAARAQIAALEADPIVAQVKGDFKTATSDYKSSGQKMDADLAKAIEESDAALAAIKTAGEIAGGTDAPAAMAAVGSAQNALYTLGALRPVANDAYVKAKRRSFKSSTAAARSIATQITQLAAVKKPGVFASSERKEAYKYVVATEIWARERVDLVDQVAGSVATADRKAVAKYASQAATTRTELDAALVNVRTEVAKVTN